MISIAKDLHQVLRPKKNGTWEATGIAKLHAAESLTSITSGSGIPVFFFRGFLEGLYYSKVGRNLSIFKFVGQCLPVTFILMIQCIQFDLKDASVCEFGVMVDSKLLVPSSPKTRRLDPRGQTSVLQYRTILV